MLHQLPSHICHTSTQIWLAKIAVNCVRLEHLYFIMKNLNSDILVDLFHLKSLNLLGIQEKYLAGQLSHEIRISLQTFQRFEPNRVTSFFGCCRMWLDVRFEEGVYIRVETKGGETLTSLMKKEVKRYWIRRVGSDYYSETANLQRFGMMKVKWRSQYDCWEQCVRLRDGLYQKWATLILFFSDHISWPVELSIH